MCDALLWMLCTNVEGLAICTIQQRESVLMIFLHSLFSTIFIVRQCIFSAPLMKGSGGRIGWLNA